MSDDPTLADDLRKAAKNPSGIFPPWMYAEMERIADQIDASDARWAKLAEGGEQ